MRTKLYKQIESIGTSVEDKAKYIHVANVKKFTYSNPSVLYGLKNLEEELKRYEYMVSYLLDEENVQRLNEANKKSYIRIVPRTIDIFIDKTLPEEIRKRAEQIKETIFQHCLPRGE